MVVVGLELVEGWMVRIVVLDFEYGLESAVFDIGYVLENAEYRSENGVEGGMDLRLGGVDVPGVRAGVY